MEWTVYDKTGTTERCKVHKIEYNGTWMGECFVTADITSPSPIAFEIGDYLEYRDERFEINYDPSILKKARKNSVGNAFTYTGVKFNDLSDELTRCDFLDFVKKDNKIHYTSLPKFSFYAASVQDLADRIQVNLDRIYTGDKKWTVVVHPEYADTTDANIEVNNIKVWDALGLAYSQFNASYIIRGRTITIGTAGIAVGNMFKYGKGNGLKELERQAESDQQIITRLRAYGSTKNLPSRYYANLGRKYFVTVNSINSISPEQTILSFNVDLGKEFEEDMFTRKVPDVGDEHSWYHYYVSFEVYGITVSGKIECFPPGSSTQDKRSANLFARGEDMGDEEKSKLSEIISLVQEETPDKVYITSGVNIADMPSSNIYYLEDVPNNMAVNHLMLPGFPDETTDPHIDSDNIEALGIREASVFFDGSTEELPEIYPTMEGMTAEDLRNAGIPVSLDAGDNGKLDEIVSADNPDDDGMPNSKGEAQKSTFSIVLKDIGFDINDYLSEETATISPKNGMCGGREFEITKVEASGNKWNLTCNRVYDEGIGLFFPNSDYTIDAGDKYVLININMPDVYIEAASQRLLTAAKEYLAEHDYVRYTYFPKVDNIYMARQHDQATAKGELSIHDTIKEGDLMLFEDEDLNINGSIIIDQLTITEGEEGVPQYTVTLREEKVTGSLQKMQNQIDSIVNKGLQGMGGLTTQQIQSIIRAYGAQLFLSKTRPDATEYLLRLLGGAHFGEFASSLMNGTGGSIDSHGNAELETLRLRSALIVKELIFNRWTAQEGNTTFTEAGTIDAVKQEEDGTYTLTIRRRWEYDVTAFGEQDVCYGSVNDLSQGGGKYRDAWFRVLSVNQTANTLSVVMYPDNEVPGGQNYAPEVGMVVTRRGNATNTERQGFWYLSSYEGCICFLDGVTKPILEESNYAIIIGKLKRLSLFDNLPINYLHSYVYCRGMAIQDLLRIDYEGNPVVTLNDRGFWSLEVAQSDNPYTAGQETVDTVWHYGCRWKCLVTGTTDEPRYASTGWAMIEGNPAFTISIDSSAGWAFDAGQLTEDVPFTTLTVSGQLYNRDVTEHLLDADISWTRDTGNVSEDNAWAIKKAEAGKSLPLVADDLGLEFKQRGVCSFKCTATLRDGQETQMAENIVTF